MRFELRSVRTDNPQGHYVPCKNSCHKAFKEQRQKACDEVTIPISGTAKKV